MDPGAVMRLWSDSHVSVLAALRGAAVSGVSSVPQ
jgi:hypothetical protein